MRNYLKAVFIICFLLICATFYLYQSPETRAQRKAPQPSNLSASQEKSEFPSNLNLECSGCHGVGKTLPNLAGEQFHKDAHGAMDSSIHAKLGPTGEPAASCMACHSINGDMTTILPGKDPRSTINRSNIAQTCGKCHNNPALMAGNGNSNHPFLAYQESVHGKALSRGNLKAAVCSDCHTGHSVRPANDERSTVSKFNVAATCGKCHGDIAVQFNNSVHGTSLARGNYQAPNCTDCHGIHSISAQKDARSALGLGSCSQCHDGVRLTKDFGIPSDRVSSFQDSYHGRATRLGSDVVADCASCHGVHNILPSSDPKSLINPANLVKTCGQCHIGAGENFAAGKVHLQTSASQDIGSIGKNWVRMIYLILIFAVIGGMVVHNGIIWYRKAKAKRDREQRTIVRMSVNQRVQHWLLLTSFIVLVLSGFALEYPDSWLGWMTGNTEAIRRVIHRIAAVVMMAVGIYHVLYLIMFREGRHWLIAMLPKWKDVTDLYLNFRHFVLNSGEGPKFARFRYIDKAEYWAVIWGTAIMALTGLMIWFKVELFGSLPRWVIDIASSIHLYEAVLATLAIIVWHFYAVIFDPDVYPINWAFYDGRMSEELFKEEHEQAYEEMKEEETRDAQDAADALAGENESEPEEQVDPDEEDKKGGDPGK